MATTHVNAFKAELDAAIATAKASVEHVYAKYQALLEQLEGEVQEIVQEVAEPAAPASQPTPAAPTDQTPDEATPAEADKVVSTKGQN